MEVAWVSNTEGQFYIVLGCLMVESKDVSTPENNLTPSAKAGGWCWEEAGWSLQFYPLIGASLSPEVPLYKPIRSP